MILPKIKIYSRYIDRNP